MFELLLKHVKKEAASMLEPTVPSLSFRRVSFRSRPSFSICKLLLLLLASDIYLVDIQVVWSSLEMQLD